MKVLITNQAWGDILHRDMIRAELVIKIWDSGMSFDVLKNRYGSTDQDIDISLLPKVIANPGGRLAQDWK